METIAVYSESRIKTYGFQIRTDLTLMEIALTPQGMIDDGNGLTRLGENGITFQFVLMPVVSDDDPRLYLVVEERFEKPAIEILEDCFKKNEHGSIVKVKPVGMIQFHGPHYGERYGIAATIFGTLNRNGIELLLSGCSASSVYLVMYRDRLESAASRLAETFEVPTKPLKKRK